MDNYLDINKIAWNNKTDVHKTSDFYDMESFMAGRSTLNDIELELLEDVTGKSILHLQCHFGQDSLSLQRMGAQVTGVDLSPKSIELAEQNCKILNLESKFICSDVYSLREKHHELHDIVFTSYGTIIWLPDLDKWAKVIYDSLKPGGKLVFADFHPLVWMYDDDLDKVIFSYFNTGAIVEQEEGTYADKKADLKDNMVTWNHSMSETISALIGAGLSIEHMNEYNYAPYNFIAATEEFEKGKYRAPTMGDKFPLVYSIVARKA